MSDVGVQCGVVWFSVGSVSAVWCGCSVVILLCCVRPLK